jgi:hypothetical protein
MSDKGGNAAKKNPSSLKLRRTGARGAGALVISYRLPVLRRGDSVRESRSKILLLVSCFPDESSTRGSGALVDGAILGHFVVFDEAEAPIDQRLLVFVSRGDLAEELYEALFQFWLLFNVI